MSLNIECKHDVSDDDCYKCMKRGIIYCCPPRCEYFEDDGMEQFRQNLKKQKDKDS